LGSGNIILTGTATSTFAGPLQITTTTQPQLVVRYDSTNYLTASVSSTGLTSLVSTGALDLTGAGSSTWQTINYGSLTIQSASSTEIVSGDTLTASSTDEMIFATAGQERMRILTSGYVGIATTSPVSLLTVHASTTDYAITLRQSAEANAGAFLHIYKPGTEILTILNNGNVGIGTTDPSDKLTVFGGDIVVGDGTATTTISYATSTFAHGLIVDTNTLYVMADTNNVGIGTTGPTSLLELYKNTSAQSNPVLTITNASTTADIDPTIAFRKSTTDEWKIYMDDSDSDKFKIATTTADVFTIDQSGNVGIATTTPSYKLHVWGSAGFGTSTTPTLYVDSGNGRVGVGTTSPGAALDVNGAIKLEGGNQDFSITEVDETDDPTGYTAGLGYGGIAISGNDGSNRQMFMFTDGATTNNIFSITSSVDSGSTWNSRFVVQQDGNVGIATTTPSYKLHVWGSAGFGTSTTPTLFVDSGTGRVGIASSTPIEALTVQGNIFGTGSLTISGNLMPTDPRTQDIGSDDYDWQYIYVDSVFANNINAASSTIAGTSAETFTINSDTSLDATSSLRFYKGTDTPHALLTWDAGYDRFNLNFPLYLSVTGDITASGALTLYSGSSLDITLDSAGKIVLSDDTDINGNLDVSGSLTVGSADQFYIDSSGNATTTGVFYAAAFYSASDDATIRKSGDQIVRGVVPIFGFDLPARTASGSYTQVSRYIENDAFPSAYSGTDRKYKFAIRYADATTTVASMWQIATSSDASSFTFTVPVSDTTDLAKGNAYITDTTSLPALPWRLDVKTGGSGDYSIQVYDIVLIAVDEVN